MSGVQLHIDSEILRPFICQVVAEVLAQVEADDALLNGRLALTESEAAALLSLQHHQLRDERLRGRIHASVGPGRKILYSKADLLGYLASRRWKPSGE